MTDQRAEAIELAKRLVASCHPKTPPPLSTALLAEVEAREKAEFMAQAFEEGSAEWEERCNTAESKVKELRIVLARIKRALDVAANQLEGVSLAVLTHGQNINTAFFIDEYKHYSVVARQAMDDNNL